MADNVAEPVGASAGDRSVLRAVLVAVGLGLAGPILALVFSLPVSLLIGAVTLPPLVAIALLLIAGQYLAFGGLAVGYLTALRDLDFAAVRDYLGVEVPDVRDLIVVVGGWVLIFGLLLVIGIVVQSTGAETAENQAGQLAEQIPSLIPPLIVAMFLVVGPCEEILYRGVVQGRLREALGPVPSILLASATFAVVHVGALTGGLNARLTTIAILFVPSLVFGAAYEYTENLVVPALIHAIHNSVLLALLWVTLQYAPEETTASLVGTLVAAVPL